MGRSNSSQASFVEPSRDCKSSALHGSFPPLDATYSKDYDFEVTEHGVQQNNPMREHSEIISIATISRGANEEVIPRAPLKVTWHNMAKLFF